MDRPLRAIVVDDSRIAAKLLAAELIELGFEARTASSLDEVGPLSDAFQPDVVLTDLHMPDVAEEEICTRLAQVLKGRRVPIWIFSALGDEELSQRTVELGADGYLSKTSTPEEMRMRLLELMRHLEREKG